MDDWIKALAKAFDDCVERVEKLQAEAKMDDYLWSEKNLQKYRGELSGEKADGKPHREVGHKLFFIPPVSGTVYQNLDLIELVTCYKSGNVSEKVLLKMAFELPSLQIEIMSETAPRSGEFEYRKYDLLEAIIEKRDGALLRKLLPIIDLTKYCDSSSTIDELLR